MIVDMELINMLHELYESLVTKYMFAEQMFNGQRFDLEGFVKRRSMLR